MKPDGIADLTDISAPSNGLLIDHGDGTWTYEPDYNFVGTETFVYTLRSSAGNSQSFTNRVTVTPHAAFKETWQGISGNAISDLTGHPNYPNQPDETELADSLHIAPGSGDAYGTRFRALLLPPETGRDG